MPRHRIEQRSRLRGMRIVSAAEAVAGIRVGPAGLPALRGRGPVRPARRPRGAVRRTCTTSRIVHLHTEGPAPHLAPGDGRPLPPPCAVRRAECPRGGQRRPGRLRAGLPVRRPATSSAAGSCRSTPSSSTSPRPTRHGFCSLGTSDRGDARRDRARPGRSSCSSTGRCRARSARASSMSAPSTWRSRSTSRRTSIRSRRDRRRRAADRRVRGRAHPGRRDAPAGDRRHPGRVGPRPGRQARPGHPHRDVHRRRGRAGRARRRHRRPQGAQPGQDRGRVRDGHAAACTTSSTTTRWSRCGRSTTPTTRPSSATFRPDDRDQLGHRGRPDRPGRGRLDRLTASTAASAARWTSCAARRSPGAAGRSSPCPRRARGSISRIVSALQDGRRRRDDPGPRPTIVTEWGVAELFGRSLRERAAALIAIAHPDHRDQLTSEARRLGLG